MSRWKFPTWCCSWRTIHWCALDILTRCKVPAICDAHDRAITKEMLR